jgi:hypothetical protein
VARPRANSAVLESYGTRTTKLDLHSILYTYRKEVDFKVPEKSYQKLKRNNVDPFCVFGS